MTDRDHVKYGVALNIIHSLLTGDRIATVRTRPFGSDGDYIEGDFGEVATLVMEWAPSGDLNTYPMRAVEVEVLYDASIDAESLYTARTQ